MGRLFQYQFHARANDGAKKEMISQRGGNGVAHAVMAGIFPRDKKKEKKMPIHFIRSARLINFSSQGKSSLPLLAPTLIYLAIHPVARGKRLKYFID